MGCTQSKQMAWFLLVHVLKIREAFPWGDPRQGKLVEEEERRRQELPRHGLQCQVWKHGGQD